MKRVVGCLAIAIAGCIGGVSLPTGPGGGGGGGGGGPTASVTVQDNAYLPPTLAITVGTKVNWTNNGPSSHTVTSDSAGGFDSGTLAPPSATSTGGLFQVTFNTPGTFTYHCIFHPTTMRGTISVQ